MMGPNRGDWQLSLLAAPPESDERNEASLIVRDNDGEAQRCILDIRADIY